MKRLLLISLSMIGFAACGSNGGNGTVDGPTGPGPDSPGPLPDAHPDGAVPPGCTPGATQCSDCIDNDHDGRIDGYDVECTGPDDDDEGSFATGIPGDNMDPKWQDCFFDGDSGAGNDHCRFHTCCLLGATSGADCPVDANFDPATDCPMQTQQCIDFCAPLTPPGCDCFSCCTLCDAATGQCRDVIVNPAVAPNCDEDHILDPVACPGCTQNTECGTPCDPTMCILCPGQDPSDLPPECGGTNVCPGGQQECTTQACPADSYCLGGCCVSIIQ